LVKEFALDCDRFKSKENGKKIKEIGAWFQRLWNFFHWTLKCEKNLIELSYRGYYYLIKKFGTL